MNFADELFQNIFEREQSQDGSEFIDDHRHPAVARAQFQKHFARGLAFRHDGNFMKQAPHIELGCGPAFLRAALPVEQHPHDVLDVNVPEHLLSRALEHRQPRTLRRDEDAHHIVQRGVGGHEVHVGPRHHQLPHLHSVEFDRAEDEFLFLHPNEAAFARLLNLNLQFFRGVNLRVACESRKIPVR